MLKNKIIYLLLVAYSIVFAILYNEYISALVVLVVFVVPVVLLTFLVATFPFVHVELVQQLQSINVGEPTEIQILIQNKSVFPIALGLVGLFYGNSYERRMEKEKVSITLDRKSKKVLTFSMTPKHCGSIKVVCDDIRLFDYFRLFSLRKKVRMQVALPVFPPLSEIETEWEKSDPYETIERVQAISAKGGDDVSELLQIRSYQQGDRLQRIHWKLSFKKEEWMVKEFSSPIDCKVNIFVELGVCEKEKNLLQVMDALMETVLTLSNRLSMDHIPHHINWYEKSSQECCVFKVEKEEEVYLAMTDLLQGNLYGGEQMILPTFESMYGLPYDTLCFYITPFLSQEIIEDTFLRDWEALHIFYVNQQGETSIGEDSRVVLVDINNVKESLNEVII